MSERFNFYDIYGYLLPGLLLFALFWLPFGLGGQGWPNEEVSKALLLLFAAYIAGHLLQSLALVIVPSKFRDENKVLRNPSSILLDETNGKFTKSFKKDLGARIKDEFGLDVLGTSEEELKNRDTTLFQARAYLIRKKAASYVEQFQGLYAMLRGLGCAFFLGSVYLVGWVLSFHWKVKCLGFGVWLLLIVSCGGAVVLSAISIFQDPKKQRPLDLWFTPLILAAALGLGYFLGTWKPAPSSAEFFLCAAIPIAIIAGLRCMREYRKYAWNFAETVWRDFLALHRESHAVAAEQKAAIASSSEPSANE
jgi:hypothetical protein